jgi:hypothetical protein
MTRFACSLLVCLGLSLVSACAYPRRVISLNPTSSDGDSTDAPANVYRITIVSAAVPPEQRSGQAWDEDSGPDVYVRVLRGERLLFETPVLSDAPQPVWNAALPANLDLSPNGEVRFEVLEADGIATDPVGILRTRGLPASVQPGGETVLPLDAAGATLRLHVDLLQAHRGIGIREVEERSDALVIVALEANSPAGRGGLAVGDRIVRIASESVASLGGPRAASRLSQSAGRGVALDVVTVEGEARTVELDAGFTWLTL